MKNSTLKSIVSLTLALTVTVSFTSIIGAAAAEETHTLSKYPYAVFASDDQAGISLELESLTLNGNGYTNGTVTNTAQAGNMNGIIYDATEEAPYGDLEAFDVNRDMIYIHSKLFNKYFTDDCQTYNENLVLSELNNNIDQPVYVVGKINIDGNLALNSAIGAVSDITLSNGNFNSNNSVIYSKFGNIRLEGEQISVNGLVYAPFGNVIIDCTDFNTNGLIIAQNVFINGSGANINYNESIAEFVGTETESFSWSMEDFEFLADTDSDGLPDVIEKEYKTDPFLADTDGDSLPDGYEVFTLYTDPSTVDTDDNGITDNNEDFDSDGLNNGNEFIRETSPFIPDSDGDTLSDGDEINKYSTDPLAVDTDLDGLDDGDEIYFNTDPNVQDTDGNGIMDGDEKRDQTFIHEVRNTESAVTEVTVSMNGTGNLQRNMKIHSVMGTDYKCSNAVGLVGEPFSIKTSAEFDQATLSFKIDQSKLGDTDFNDLLFLWHDEENHEFVELDTIYDLENSTVSTVTTHFSRYMVVDKEKWYEAWAVKFNYNPHDTDPSYPVIRYNTVLAIDCSGSMSWNDPVNATCKRIEAAEGFINNMNSNDKAAIVLFDNYAYIKQDLTDDREALLQSINSIYSSGGTDFDEAINKSISILETYALQNQTTNRILFLSDGEARYDKNVLDYANTKQITIHTVGLGSSSNDLILQEIAKYTGGEFYKAFTADELIDIYKDFGISGDFDTTDTDGDGLYDAVETAGIRLENGTIIYTDPTLKDTDGDGLEDGEEIDPRIHWKAIGDTAGYVRDKEYYFVMYSDPTGGDTDGDGSGDNDDDDDPLTNDSCYFASEEYFEDLEERTEDEVSSMRYLQNYYQIYCGYKAENMMEDFNTYDQYFGVSSLTEDRWEAFISNFSSAVSGYGTVTQEIHYFRNKLNRAPATLDDLLDEKDDWELLEVGDSLYHMYNEYGEYNVKFISKDGHYEAVYNKNGILLSENNDPDNMGTFNYKSPSVSKVLHGLLDVEPYYLWGNVEGGTIPNAIADPIGAQNLYDSNPDAQEYRRGVEMLLDGDPAGEAIVKADYSGAYLVTSNFNYPVAYSLQDNRLKFPELEGGFVGNYTVSYDTVIVLDDRGFCTQGYDNATGFNFVNFYFVPFINNQLTKMY